MQTVNTSLQTLNTALANQSQIAAAFQQNKATQSQLNQANAAVAQAQSTYSAAQNSLQTATVQLQAQIDGQQPKTTSTISSQLSPTSQQKCVTRTTCVGNCNVPYYDSTAKLVTKTVCSGTSQATTATHGYSQQGSADAGSN